MKKRKQNRRHWAMLMLAVMLISIFAPTTAVAAAELDPYAYCWEDASNVTHYQHFIYVEEENAYMVDERVTSVGGYVFDAEGEELYSGALVGEEHIGYAKDGTLYVVLKNGNLEKRTTNDKETTYKSKNYSSLVLDSDGLVVSVKLKDGTVIKLKDLTSGTSTGTTPTPTPSPTPTPTPETGKNRVERTGAVNQTIKAYKNDKVVVQLYIEKAKVTEQLANVRLSDACKGAKFLGVDAEYSVYLYEIGGTFYKFQYGNWYIAQKVEVNGEMKKYEEDQNGFITKIITTEGTYVLAKDELEFAPTKTYAVSKETYTQLYVKDSEETHKLELKDKVLYLDGKKVTSSVEKFQFIDAETFIFVKTNGKSYTASIDKPTSLTLFKSNVKALVVSKDNGLATHVTINSKNYKIK